MCDDFKNNINHQEQRDVVRPLWASKKEGKTPKTYTENTPERHFCVKRFGPISSSLTNGGCFEIGIFCALQNSKSFLDLLATCSEAALHVQPPCDSCNNSPPLDTLCLCKPGVSFMRFGCIVFRQRRSSPVLVGLLLIGAQHKGMAGTQKR